MAWNDGRKIHMLARTEFCSVICLSPQVLAVLCVAVSAQTWPEVQYWQDGEDGIERSVAELTPFFPGESGYLLH